MDLFLFSENYKNKKDIASLSNKQTNLFFYIIFMLIITNLPKEMIRYSGNKE